MGTRSLIGYKLGDGSFRVAYCHWDGYIEGVGAKLHEHYQNFDKVKQLIDQGNISELYGSCTKPKGHSFDSPVAGYTIYYGRDRGDTDGHLSNIAHSLDYFDFHYNYCFMDGQWFVKTKSKWTPLADHFDTIPEPKPKRVRNPTLRGYLAGKHSDKVIFNFVRQQMNEQGRPATSESGGSCVYHAKDGSKCSVGHLISAKDMKAIMTDHPYAANSALYGLLILMGYDNVEQYKYKIEFLNSLRRAHDNSVFGGTDRIPDDQFLKQFNSNMDYIARNHCF